MHRPQDLFDSVEYDAIAWLLARVICGETAVITRMPIFGRNDDIKARLQFIGEEDDFITVRHWQGAAGQKIILKINDDQRVHWCAFLSPFVKGRGERQLWTNSSIQLFLRARDYC